ncbi:hypothetical protein Ahy_B09g098230 [Arachis hypogaea]|uniref:Protein FAR1-RELATED SEQUENCE n=1 Tax=Arachis hypogaea TaxID=3818 RepID=A0A444XQR5_ARAHY|nr:hypothetical protein Ahy_B09g098230 [Arachis hypogaea]
MQIQDFEIQWTHIMEEYCLHDKPWAIWANAYLADKFCAEFRTTSRCEGINAFVNKLSRSMYSLLELVQDLELFVQEYRNRKLLFHFRTIYNLPVMTTCLKSIETYTARVYTKEIFCDVRKQIEGIRTINFVIKRRCLNTMVYTFEEYGNPDVHIMALFDRSYGKVDC